MDDGQKPIPTVYVDAVMRHGELCFKVWCKQCKAFNYHDPSESHRWAAHCECWPGGYILKLKPGYKWAVTSVCPPELSRQYFDTEEMAVSAKKAIDEAGCGGRCRGKAYHSITVLKVRARHA